MELGYYKINGDSVANPIFATDGSACFDLRVDLTTRVIKVYSDQDVSFEVYPGDTGTKRILGIDKDPTLRWMIPTGLVFDIPTGFHLDVYMRGGTGLKRGLRLANGTGI